VYFIIIAPLDRGGGCSLAPFVFRKLPSFYAVTGLAMKLTRAMKRPRRNTRFLVVAIGYLWVVSCYYFVPVSK
jgi:hypothetical protein